jgi:hypothetical protein
MADPRPEDVAEVVSPREVELLREFRIFAQRHGPRAIAVLADVMENGQFDADRVRAASKLLKIAGVEMSVLRVLVEKAPGVAYGRPHALVPTEKLKAALALVPSPYRPAQTASQATVEVEPVPTEGVKP